MKINKAQLQTLCEIVEIAGREVMAIYSRPIAVSHKDDDSPLTEADLRSDTVIRDGLESAFPGVFVLSEEFLSTEDMRTDTFFLVDPLDGTKEFLKRNDEFTVNVALVHQGQVVAGVVLAPALGELFYAGQGLGSWKKDLNEGIALQVLAYDDSKPLRIIGSRSHGLDALTVWLNQLTYEHTFVVAGSSLKFCRIAEGQADIYPRFGLTSQWDTAAAQCILEVAGGAVVNLSGKILRYGLDRPILNPEFIAVGDKRLLEVAMSVK